MRCHCPERDILRKFCKVAPALYLFPPGVIPETVIGNPFVFRDKREDFSLKILAITAQNTWSIIKAPVGDT
jgi:hypothetical protein